MSCNAGSSDSDFSGETEDGEELGDEEEGKNFDEFEDAEETGEAEDKTKKVITTDYGKVAKGIATALRSGTNISLPDINKAQIDFFPDIASNSILYGLQAVSGVNPDLANTIINNRPYTSLEDFLAKVNITNVQMIYLVKGGCFDSLYPKQTRSAIMKHYLRLQAMTKVKKKESLTKTDFKKMVELNIVPKTFDIARRVWKFQDWMKENEYDKTTKRYIVKSEASIIFFTDYYKFQLTLGENYDIIPEGYAVQKKAFEAISNNYLAALNDWLDDPATNDMLYEAKLEAQIQEVWDKYCQGSDSKWEMTALHFYHSQHELHGVNIYAYHISPFESLPEELKPTGTKVNRQGVSVPIYNLVSICGTVINSDNNKHIVTILTPYGEVVDVKYYATSYNFFNKKISQVDKDGHKHVIENSWFERGNLLLLAGVRRENSFLPKTDWSKGFKYSTQLIQGISNGVLKLKSERETF